MLRAASPAWYNSSKTKTRPTDWYPPTFPAEDAMRAALVPLLLVLLFAGPILASPPDGAGLQFFEQKVRPVLVKHCYECHSATAKKHRGGLLLDTREGIRKGGETGPAVTPGDLARSLLLKAVRYDGLEMPPKTKGQLPANVIADLETWIKIGAPDPRDKAAATVVQASWEQVLAQRRRWWSLQPVRKPAVPTVADQAWSANPVDRFLLARLEAAGLKPAGEADRRTLLRRLSLVLTGLPPTPEEVEAFVKESQAKPQAAYERAVDRLLASPHFGERWAQHWLDTVRYSETHGNEWNYEVQFAYRYRDYLIRAFNQDVPCDQLIREHLAGDLLPRPRWNAKEKFNESVIGTTFYRFGDGNVEDCSAVPQVAFDVIDNQIDTLSKAFQATTVACARCHDHKLDAVSMKDYYALVGILHSSRQLTHTIDSPDTNAGPMRHLRALKADIRKELAAGWLRETEEIGRYLLATQARRSNVPGAAELARGLDPARLQRWVDALKVELAKKTDPPVEDLFTPWRSASAGGAKGFAEQWRKQAEHVAQQQRERSAFNREHFQTFSDFRSGNLAGWQTGGQGLRDGLSPAGDFALHHDGDAMLRAVYPAGCFTHTLSEKLNGTLRSPLLPRNSGKKISFEVLGRHHSGATLVSHNCQLSDHNYSPVAADQLEWVTFSLPEDPAGLHCYAELATMFDNPKFPDPIVKAKNKDKEDYRVPWDRAAANPRSFFGVTRVVLHDGTEVPRPDLGHLQPLFADTLPATPAEGAARYAAVVKSAVQAWALNRASDNDVRWIDGLLQRGLLGNSVKQTPRLAELTARYRAIEAELTLPRVIHGIGDFGPGFEQPLFVRGDCARPGERVSRRYLEVLSRPGERFVPTGSGRLELAERIISPANPLTARVMVNRIWQHVFGEGLVRTVDDFGRNGEQPSHPELLDYLASRFVADGQSFKRLIRSLVLTRTFRLTNQPTESARSADPQNRLLHHYAPRRLEAEGIRDSILAASGRLDRTLYGPSVEPCRDKEIAYQRLFSGPLDGRGRRSLYVKHTLMEAPKFLEAFNLPKGNVMQGRRDVTNVPTQALALLNDPFVLQQAEVWAGRLVGRPDRTPGERIEHLFLVAFGRPPRSEERSRFENAVRRLAELHQAPADRVLQSQAIWKDVAHTLFNLKEFIYVP